MNRTTYDPRRSPPSPSSFDQYLRTDQPTAIQTYNGHYSSHASVPYFDSARLSANRCQMMVAGFSTDIYLRYPCPWRERRKNLYDVPSGASLFRLRMRSKNEVHLSGDVSFRPNLGGTWVDSFSISPQELMYEQLTATWGFSSSSWAK